MTQQKGTEKQYDLSKDFYSKAGMESSFFKVIQHYHNQKYSHRPT